MHWTLCWLSGRPKELFTSQTILLKTKKKNLGKLEGAGRCRSAYVLITDECPLENNSGVRPKCSSFSLLSATQAPLKVWLFLIKRVTETIWLIFSKRLQCVSRTLQFYYFSSSCRSQLGCSSSAWLGGSEAPSPAGAWAAPTSNICPAGGSNPAPRDKGGTR